ncbi:hypothetical protein M3Y98_00397400 [Aphelenchoides besseyi]|nr:hypothetical protein M3Y98_00397400 [Aphelenchoides besseyi]KAI6202416.1 hypothetical protein M3Y96_00946200 [Aphelenchoides besseyi]
MKKQRPTPTATRKKKTAVPARRKYTEGERVACSIDKNTAGREHKPSLQQTEPNQAKFVHASRTKTSQGTNSEHSKPANAKQRACRQWFDGVVSKGVRGIRSEFIQKVQKYKNLELAMTAGDDPANMSKNRYDDVHLIDKTRVKVSINPDGDDYIHASYVNVSPELQFICSQGPLNSTIHQFWLMCIQEDIKLILQLCKNMENGEEKCAEYFVSDSTDWSEFGPVQVRVLEKGQPVPGMRKVVKTKIEAKFDSRTAIVTHLLFYGWPDHGMAESLPTCRELRTLVHKLHQQKPVVVHCAAGIGRTGTFTAVEMICQKLLVQQTAEFTVVDLIKELRNQRFKAVQNDRQYLFIHRCVLEIVIADDGLAKSNDVIEFIKKFDDFVERKKKEGGAHGPRSRRQ